MGLGIRLVCWAIRLIYRVIRVMKLNNFEDDINPTIMQRGQDYFDSNTVQELEETEPQFWQAWVEGTHNYDIEVSLNKQNIESWNCSCPYDGPVCKHVAATLLSIRETTSKTKKQKTKSPSKQQQLSNVLKQLSKDQLETKLTQLLSNNRAERDKMLLEFQPYTGSKEATVTRYRSLFNKLVTQYSSHGFIEYRAARGFIRELWDLLDTLDPTRISPDDCVKSCFALFEILEQKVVNAIDDSDGGTGEIMQKCADILLEAYPLLSEPQQAYCFTQLLFWDLESQLEDYGLGQYLEELTLQWANDKPEQQTEYLSSLDSALKKTNSKWRKDSLNKRKLQALSDWGKASEAEAFAKEKMDVPEFRQLFVDKAIQAQDFAEARSLIAAGIEIAQAENHPGTVNKWREVLLTIAEQSNDITAVREELVAMQQNSWFKIQLYQKLKATFSADDWEKMRHDYTRQILGERNQPDAQAEIHLEENELRELFDLIRAQGRGSVAMFKRYLNTLAPVFPEETVALYSRVIQQELQTTGRPVYDQAVRNIKHLKTLPFGDAAADQLIKAMMLKHNNRPSMLAIFRKAFGVA